MWGDCMKTMWKAAICAALAVGVLGLAGCGSDQKSAAGSAQSGQQGQLLQKIKQKGELVVGTSSGFPPYEFVDTSKSEKTVTGIDIALAQKIADKLGVKLVVQDMSFSSLLSSIAANKIDIAISAINATDERRKAVDFSKPYMHSPHILLIRKEDAGKYKTLEDFRGKTVGAQKSTLQEQLAHEQIPDAKVVALDKVPDTLIELEHGKLDAVASQGVVAQQYLVMNPDLADSGVKFENVRSSSSVAVPKGNEDLIQIINEVIDENEGNVQGWIKEYSELAVANAKK